MKKIIILLVCVLMALPCIHVSAKQEKLVILLDPGHGGSDAGASASSGGEILLEKDCNLFVAMAVKERLEATGRAVVYMTRNDDTYVSLKARTDMLPDCGAQLFCSIHCNSGAPDAFGTEVLVPYGAAYNVETAQRGQEIGRTVAQELGKLGLRVRRGDGLYRRSTELSSYPDGSDADYYGVLYQSTLQNIPSLLVETCFISNASDRETYLSTEEGRNALAGAIASALEQYLPEAQASAPLPNKPAVDSERQQTEISLSPAVEEMAWSPVEALVLLVLLLSVVAAMHAMHKNASAPTVVRRASRTAERCTRGHI